MEVHAVYDTGGAALDVSNVGDPDIAAVASRNAAHRYKLSVLVPDIEDRPDNQTRFLVVSRTPEIPSVGTPVRTTVIITHDDRPGALECGLFLATLAGGLLALLARKLRAVEVVK